MQCSGDAWLKLVPRELDTQGKWRHTHALSAVQAQAELESLSLGLGPRAQASLNLQRAACALDKCSLTEHLSYVALVSSECS